MFGYCIYVLEREYQPDLFTFGQATFLSLQCITTGYANDSFDLIVPTNKRTQMVCIFATVCGLFLTSFLIGIATEKILPSRFEKQAVFFLAMRR